MMDTNMSSRLTCEVSGIQETKERTKTQNLSLLQPNKGPQILMGPIDPASKENFDVPSVKPLVEPKIDPTPRKPLAVRPSPNEVMAVQPTPSKQVM